VRVSSSSTTLLQNIFALVSIWRVTADEDRNACKSSSKASIIYT
jgi:hypothetical protein